MIKQNVLDVLNLCKSYGNHLVLDDISFSIRENEIVGFIGPNGAGKSTLMKCLCGLIHMDSGHVTICGHDIQSQREKALSHQASLIESPGLFFNMTGYENLEIFASLKNVSKDKLQQMADYTRIGDYLKKPVSSYSLGMKQRLALSIALLSSPQFLMLDEPMNGLDPSGVFELRKELRKMVDEYGMSLLISSHQLNEIENNQEEAFKIQFKIFNLFLENDKCWKVLKQFEDHGQILPFESSEDFSNLSYTALCKLRQNKYTSVSKRKKTIAEWKAELPSLPLKKRGQKELNILEKEKELQRFLNDIEKLSNLINEKE